jgi:hypothetical protein
MVSRFLRTAGSNTAGYRQVGSSHVVRIRRVVISPRCKATCVVSQVDSFGRGCGLPLRVASSRGRFGCSQETWRLVYPILRSASALDSFEIEGVMNRRCQQFLLIWKKEPDLAPQCRNRDCHNVVDADDAILIKPVARADRNFGRQAANCSGDRCDGDSGQVRPHHLPSQDENRPRLVQLGDVNWSQSISSPKVDTCAASASKSSPSVVRSARIFASRAAISRRRSRSSALSTNDARLSACRWSTSLSMKSTTSSGSRTAICLVTVQWYCYGMQIATVYSLTRSHCSRHRC